MSQSKTKKKHVNIEAIQAYAQGKPIQFFDEESNTWKDCPHTLEDDTFDMPKFDKAVFRPKPLIIKKYYWWVRTADSGHEAWFIHQEKLAVDEARKALEALGGVIMYDKIMASEEILEVK